MKLPNSDLATVAREKIMGYLLSDTHPDGSQKARFFKRFGYHPGRWERLAQDLLMHARRHPVVRAVESEHGVRYTIEGTIEAPDGRTPGIRAIWFIEKGTSKPKFVTAYSY